VFPSLAIAASKAELSSLLAVIGWLSAMLVVLLMPFPVRLTVVGLLLALLVTVSVPVRVPPAVGVNETVTVQEPLTAMLPQLLVWLKSPVTETPETVAAVVPELVIVTVCVAEVEPTTVPAKDNPAGEALSTGPGAVPEPERLTVSVTPPALIVRLPVWVPAAVGVNVTLTVHEPFAAIDEPQVLVCAKSPLAEIDETEAAELVGLETVTVCAALVVPSACEPKFSALGAAVTVEAGYGG
jgi:hypothetical protein